MLPNDPWVIVVLIFPIFVQQFQDVLDNIICTPMPDGSPYYHDLLGATEKVTCIPLFLNVPLLRWSIFSFPPVPASFSRLSSCALSAVARSHAFWRAYCAVFGVLVLCCADISRAVFWWRILPQINLIGGGCWPRARGLDNNIDASGLWICFRFSWQRVAEYHSLHWQWQQHTQCNLTCGVSVGCMHWQWRLATRI